MNKSAVINSWFYHKNIHLVGLVSDEYGFMRGCAWGGVASGPSGSSTWGWDFDGTYADWYGAHELAHTYNRPHTLGELPNGCGQEGTVKQHTNGYISAISDLFDRKAMYGFDPYFLKVAPYYNPILGPVWHDVMTYCDKQWVSDITYTSLRDYLETLYTLPNAIVPHSAQTSIMDCLAVFGSINLQTGELATLLPMSVWFNVGDIEPRIPGAYTIVLLDAGQNELARYPFTPDIGEGGYSPLDDVEVSYAGISELVPYVAGTAQVNIEGPGGALLETVSAGLVSPTVQLLSPNGGEVLSTDLVTVTWTAVDTDNDSLSFNVYYSPDSGTQWDAVAMAITDTQVIIPSSNLMGSSSGLFRIEASDGIHTTNDTSDAVFTIPNHLPTVTIFTPESDVTIAVSQTLALEVFAYDVEMGSMDDDLVWSSSLDGILGNGSQLSTAALSVGIHLVTVQANDGQGDSASDRVTVTVVATPDDLTPTPDALLVAPHVITLYSAGGLVTTTLGIDNQNPLHDLMWQATVDQPWLTLNISVGTTFTAVTLQANAAKLAPGIYQATLTFTSPETSNLDVVVPVTLIVEPYINYLPAITR